MDTEQKIRSAGLCVNRHLFAYKINLDQLKNGIDKRDLAGAMPILSMHDDRVMYFPTGMVWPTQLKKWLFFPSFKKGSDAYEIQSLLSYVAVISKESFAPFFDEVYKEVYPHPRHQQQGQENMTASQLMKLFANSDKNHAAAAGNTRPNNKDDGGGGNDDDDDSNSGGSEEDDDDDDENNKDKPQQKAVDTTYFKNDYVDPKNQSTHSSGSIKKLLKLPCVEEHLEDNEALIVYMTESKLFKHGSNNEPFVFLEPYNLEDTEIHIPYTSAKSLYGSSLDSSSISSSSKTNSSSWRLGLTNVILQDMTEFLLNSLTMANTFTNLREFSQFMWSVYSRQADDTDVCLQADANKIAIRLRVHQEAVADMTNTGVMGYFKTTDALVFHRKYINAIVGDKTALNCTFPKRISASVGKSHYARCEGHSMAPYKGLRDFVLQGSKSYTAYTCALMYLLIRQTNSSKYTRLISSKCKQCGPICAQVTAEMYCSQLSAKQAGTTNSSYKRGVGYECITEYNTSASFAGNSNDGSGTANNNDDKKDDGGGGGGLGGIDGGKQKKMSKEVASAMVQAANKTIAAFPMFQMDKNAKETLWIKQLFERIVALSQYIENEQHGIPGLQSRHDRQTKLEMELKEVIRPVIMYLGTYFMTIRRSAIYKHMMLLVMMHDKNMRLSEYDNCRIVYTSRHCGVFWEEDQIKKDKVECERFCLEKDRDAHNELLMVTGVPQPSAARIATIGKKSSMKLKCTSSYMDVDRDSSSSSHTVGRQQDMVDASMMGLNTGGSSSGSSNSSSGGGIVRHILSPELRNLIQVKIYNAVYPSLQNHSNLTHEQTRKQLIPAVRERKLNDLLNRHPTIATVLSQIDYANVNIRNWIDFVDVYVPHAILNKYNYNPVELSGGYGMSMSMNNDTSGMGSSIGGGGGGLNNKKKRVPGIHKLLRVVQMSEQENTKPGSKGNKIVYTSKYVNKDLLTSQMLGVTTRIYPNSYFSEIAGASIYSFRIGESSSTSYAGLLDLPVFSTPHYAAFAVQLRGPYVSNKEFDMYQMFRELNELPGLEDRIRLVHNYANHLYTYIASFCGYGAAVTTDDDGGGSGSDSSDNHLTEEMGMSVLKQIMSDGEEDGGSSSELIDTETAEGALLLDLFANVFKNYKNDPDLYKETFNQILERAVKEGTGVEYIDDDEEEEEDYEHQQQQQTTSTKRKRDDEQEIKKKKKQKKQKQASTTTTTTTSSEQEPVATAAAAEEGEEEEEEENDEEDDNEFNEM